jgi:DNA-binding Xre family transcriptional regulator
MVLLINFSGVVKMMILEDILSALKDRNIKAVAAQIDVSYHTLWRLSAGKHKAVSYDVVKKLSDYLTEKKNG